MTRSNYIARRFADGGFETIHDGDSIRPFLAGQRSHLYHALEPCQRCWKAGIPCLFKLQRSNNSRFRKSCVGCEKLNERSFVECESAVVSVSWFCTAKANWGCKPCRQENRICFVKTIYGSQGSTTNWARSCIHCPLDPRITWTTESLVEHLLRNPLKLPLYDPTYQAYLVLYSENQPHQLQSVHSPRETAIMTAKSHSQNGFESDKDSQTAQDLNNHLMMGTEQGTTYLQSLKPESEGPARGSTSNPTARSILAHRPGKVWHKSLELGCINGEAEIKKFVDRRKVEARYLPEVECQECQNDGVVCILKRAPTGYKSNCENCRSKRCYCVGRTDPAVWMVRANAEAPCKNGMPESNCEVVTTELGATTNDWKPRCVQCEQAKKTGCSHLKPPSLLLYLLRYPSLLPLYSMEQDAYYVLPAQGTNGVHTSSERAHHIYTSSDAIAVASGTLHPTDSIDIHTTQSEYRLYSTRDQGIRQASMATGYLSA